MSVYDCFRGIEESETDLSHTHNIIIRRSVFSSNMTVRKTSPKHVLTFYEIR